MKCERRVFRAKRKRERASARLSKRHREVAAKCLAKRGRERQNRARRRAPALAGGGGAFHRAGSAAAFTATDVAAETGAGERLPIAVSGRNFNTVFEKARSRNPRPAWLHKYFHSEYALEQTAFPFLKRNRGQTSTSAP